MRDWRKCLGCGAGVFVAAMVAGCGPESMPTVDGMETPQLGAQHVGGAMKALLAAEQGKLVASDGAASDYFGYAVALSGGTAIVGSVQGDGAVGDQGAAYVFVHVGDAWIPQAKLTASDGAALDFFGAAVSLSIDTAIVGARYGNKGNGSQGAAYVFVREGGLWTEQQKLVPGDGAAGDNFGISVSLSGDTALVGSPYFDGAMSDQGAAYVFVRKAKTWSEQKKLLANDAVGSDLFGGAVSLLGDTALIGASYGDATNADQGTAYVFIRNGDIWNEPSKLVADDGASNDAFGHSVALSEDTALVGADYCDIGSNSDQGAAYTFVRNGLEWLQKNKLVASDGAAGDGFGFSVSLSGDNAVIGADTADIGGSKDQGAAYVFERNGSIWSEQAKLITSDGTTDDVGGSSVTLAGNIALMGAVFHNEANTDQGSAYVFLLGETCAENMLDGSVCDDGNPCTQFDTCQNGVCVGANPIVCPAPDMCWQSACNPANGVCKSWPLSDQTPCPSGVCKAGGCYADDALGSAGSGGTGSSTSNASSSSTSGAGGRVVDRANAAPEPHDIVLRGGGCHCNVVPQTNSGGLLWGIVGLLPFVRKRRRTRT